MYYYAYAPMQLAVGVLLDRYGPETAPVTGSRNLLHRPRHILDGRHATGLGASRFLVGFGSSFAFIGAIYVAHRLVPRGEDRLPLRVDRWNGIRDRHLHEWFLADIFGEPPNWRPDMLVLACCGLVLAAGIWCIIPSRPTWYLERCGISAGTTFRDALAGLGVVMRQPTIWMISLACAIVYLPLPLAANWGPRSLSELLGIPNWREAISLHGSTWASLSGRLSWAGARTGWVDESRSWWRAPRQLVFSPSSSCRPEKSPASPSFSCSSPGASARVPTYWAIHWLPAVGHEQPLGRRSPSSTSSACCLQESSCGSSGSLSMHLPRLAVMLPDRMHRTSGPCSS